MFKQQQSAGFQALHLLVTRVKLKHPHAFGIGCAESMRPQTLGRQGAQIACEIQFQSIC
jgi:hypothetical protein